MTEMNAGAAVVELLKAEGVRHVFGLPGGHVLDIYDALYECPQIRTFLVRHEHTAACMAAGFAQLTGQLAVCLVTAGPGVTNLLTAVAEAFVGSLPMVILAGRGATATRYRGASQEVDTDSIFRPVTKMSLRVDRADLLVPALRQAFAAARNGKPGPVLIDIPRDLLAQKVPTPRYVPVGPAARPRGDARQIRLAADALLTASNPIIVAGGGAVASNAFAQVRRLAEMLAIPVLTSLAGRGAIADDHPLSAGGLGAHRNRLSRKLLGRADVVLGLGTRFEEMETNWREGFVPAAAACYIQVDIDPVEIGRSIPASVGIVGDVALVLDEMIEMVGSDRAKLPEGGFLEHSRTRQCSAELTAIDAELAALADEPGNRMHALKPIRAARAALARDGIVAIDVGCLAQHMVGSQPAFPIYEPRTTIVPSSFYGMGFAASAALAGPIACPGRQTVCFVGDGSFQMVLPVLPVAVQYHLPVTWCVLNDEALGSIRDIQQYGFANRIIDTDLSPAPDFAAIARGCGCHAERVLLAEHVDGAIARAFAANARGVPAVIDFCVSRERLQGTYDHYAFYGRALHD